MSYYNKNAVSPFDAIFTDASKTNGLRYDFLRNIAQIESSYRADAKAKTSSATGVMQLIRGTGREMGLKDDADFLDPTKNIGAGAAYLARMLKASHGDEVRAALAYHSGLGSADIKNYDAGNYGAITPEGKDYINKVNGNAEGGTHAVSSGQFKVMAPPILSANQTSGDQSAKQPTPVETRQQELLASAPVQLTTGDAPDALPAPNTTFNDTYTSQHNGQDLDAFQSGPGFWEGTGKSIQNNLDDSVLGTAAHAYTKDGWRGVKYSMTPAMFGPTYDAATLQKMESTGLDPDYQSRLDGVNPEDMDNAIALAKQAQANDAEFAKQRVGIGANVVGSAVGMIGDPTTYLTMVAPETSMMGMSKWADGIGNGFARFATKTGLKMSEGATLGVASEELRSHFSGGEKDMANAAVGGAVLAGGLHILTHGYGRIRGERTSISTGDIDQSITPMEDMTPHPSDLHPDYNDPDLHHHAERNARSESARTYGVDDPSRRAPTGNETIHTDPEGNTYHFDDPNHVPDPLHPETPDIRNNAGQRVDGASPYNHNTVWKADELERMALAQRGAKTGIFHITPQSIRDIGTSANELTHPRLRAVAPRIMSAPQGVVSIAEDGSKTFSGAAKGFTGDQIKTQLDRRDQVHARALQGATKTLFKSPRYQGMTPKQARNLFGQRIVEAIEDKTGVKMNDLSAPEQKALAAVRAWSVEKHHHLMNPSEWGISDNQPLIDGLINPEHYFPVSYDLANIHQFVLERCGGDEKVAQEAVKQSLLKTYWAPDANGEEVRKIVNQKMKDEFDADLPQRQKELDKSEKHQAKMSEKLESYQRQHEEKQRGRKDEEAGIYNTLLEEHGLNTEEGIQARLNKHYEDLKAEEITRRKGKKMQKKTADKFDEQWKKEASNRLEEDLKGFRETAGDRVKSSVNYYKNQMNRYEEHVKDAMEDVEKAKARVEREITPEELNKMVEKHAEKTAFGIINQGSALDGDTLAAIERQMADSDLAGTGGQAMLKSRSGFGYDGEVGMNDGGSFSLNHLRNFDMDRLMHAHSQQANGVIATYGSTGKMPNEIATTFNEVSKEAKQMRGRGDHRGANALEKEVEVGRNALKIILGRSRTPEDARVRNAVTKVAQDLTYATHNSSFWLNNFGEAAALYTKVLTVGITKGMPMLFRLTNANRGLSSTELKSLRLGLMGHEVHQKIMPTWSDARERWNVNGQTGVGGTALTAAQQAAHFVSHTVNIPGRLLDKTTAGLAELGEKHALQDIFQDAHGVGGRGEYTRPEFLNSAGVTVEQGEAFLQMIREHSTVDAEGNVTVNNIDALRQDRRVAPLIRVVQRASDEVLQKEALNQMSTRPLSFWQNLIFQFKRFAMKSYGRSTRWVHEANGNQRKMDFALYTMMGTASSVGLYSMNTWLQSHNVDPSKRDAWLKARFDPRMLAYSAISRNPITSGLVAPFQTFGSMVGVDYAKSVRTSLSPNQQSKARNDFSTARGILNYGYGVATATAPALEMFGGAVASGVNAGRVLTADSQAELNDAKTDLFNSTGQIIPNDNISHALHRFIFTANGTNVKPKR